MSRVDNEQFYTTSLQKHGLTCKALHWNSEHSQTLRFDVLIPFIKEDISQCTIVDIGCGFGDFYLYLKQKPYKYIGIDVMPQMVQEARRRTGCEILRLDGCVDELPEADYYICSGAMNILSPYETHTFIQNCFKSSKKGFVFNILEGRDESLVYNYFQEKQIKEIALKLGAKMNLKKGYMQKDMTVGLYR